MEVRHQIISSAGIYVFPERQAKPKVLRPRLLPLLSMGSCSREHLSLEQYPSARRDEKQRCQHVSTSSSDLSGCCKTSKTLNCNIFRFSDLSIHQNPKEQSGLQQVHDPGRLTFLLFHATFLCMYVPFNSINILNRPVFCSLSFSKNLHNALSSPCPHPMPAEKRIRPENVAKCTYKTLVREGTHLSSKPCHTPRPIFSYVPMSLVEERKILTKLLAPDKYVFWHSMKRNRIDRYFVFCFVLVIWCVL